MACCTVLIVDDEPLNLAVLARLLKPVCRVLGARSGPAALALLARGELPDLILLDVMMPGMDGYTVLERLREQPAWREIPVIFVTALHAEIDEEHGLELGAVDYITKPIKPAVVMARVRAHLELKQSRDRLTHHNAELGRELARRVRESLMAQDLVLAAMAQLAETRDSTTGNHILRTQTYVELLAEHLQSDPRHARELEPAQLRRIVKAAPMHDIGKIGIPDHILLKADRLTAEEFEVMKGHAELGGRVIAEAMRAALSGRQRGAIGTEAEMATLIDPTGAAAADGAPGQPDMPVGVKAVQALDALGLAPQSVAEAPPDGAGLDGAADWTSPGESMVMAEVVAMLPVPLQELEVARVIALHHHERWDGLGYPHGLSGEDIPLAARLMAVADVFDALTTRRPYKAPWTLEDASAFIASQSGTHFDPAVVAAFQARREQFGAVAGRLAD